MTDAQYRVAGWIRRRPPELAHSYWAEFGYYETLDAARRAAAAMSAHGSTLTITLNSRHIATFMDGQEIDEGDELSFLTYLYGGPE